MRYWLCNMRIVTIIQARTGSTRLPGKVLLDIAGEPMLQRVISRARQAQLPTSTVVATTTLTADDLITDLCAEIGIPCFRGSEPDVLDRYLQAARHFEADTIVRLTADCPLLDPDIIDRTIAAFQAGQFDYLSNTWPNPSFPDGLDTEVCRFAALEIAWKEARLSSEREHVMPFLYKHPERFALGSAPAAVNLAHHRWTVDEPADLDFVRTVYTHFGHDRFTSADVLSLLASDPALSQLNAGINRNEGYQISSAHDKSWPGQETR